MNARVEIIYNDGICLVYSYHWPDGSGQPDYFELWIGDSMFSRKLRLNEVLGEAEDLQHSLSNARTSLRALATPICTCVPDHKPMFTCPEHGWAATRAGAPA